MNRTWHYRKLNDERSFFSQMQKKLLIQKENVVRKMKGTKLE